MYRICNISYIYGEESSYLCFGEREVLDVARGRQFRLFGFWFLASAAAADTNQIYLKLLRLYCNHGKYFYLFGLLNEFLMKFVVAL